MSCCGGSCGCCGSCGCGVMFRGFVEENSDTTGALVLGVSAKTGSIKASENATESGEAGHACCGCGCGSSCTCSPCGC